MLNVAMSRCNGDNLRIGGTGQKAIKEAVPTVPWPVGPILITDGGTGQKAIKEAVPTVPWPVGPILIKVQRIPHHDAFDDFQCPARRPTASPPFPISGGIHCLSRPASDAGDRKHACL